MMVTSYIIELKTQKKGLLEEGERQRSKSISFLKFDKFEPYRQRQNLNILLNKIEPPPTKIKQNYMSSQFLMSPILLFMLDSCTLIKMSNT
jgi:hypothetical protein